LQDIMLVASPNVLYRAVLRATNGAGHTASVAMPQRFVYSPTCLASFGTVKLCDSTGSVVHELVQTPNTDHNLRLCTSAYRAPRCGIQAVRMVLSADSSSAGNGEVDSSFGAHEVAVARSTAHEGFSMSLYAASLPCGVLRIAVEAIPLHDNITISSAVEAFVTIVCTAPTGGNVSFGLEGDTIGAVS
jgi:hypothetical protein